MGWINIELHQEYGWEGNFVSHPWSVVCRDENPEIISSM